jgi:hypothetical protein
LQYHSVKRQGMKRIFPLFLVSLGFYFQASAQVTVGLQLHHKGSLDSGYVLFSPIGNTTTFLIDKCGRLVHTWPSVYSPGLSVYLLPDGSILRTGMVRDSNPFSSGAGVGGIIEKIDWNGNVVWSYKLYDSTQCQHHDIEPLPNGNILAVVWDKKTLAEARAAGRRPLMEPTEVWSEKVIEIKPSGTHGGTIVWQWNVWDHLAQSYDSQLPNYDSIPLHPELLDINYSETNVSDWLHFNSIKYNPDLDQILLSNHNWSEIYVIDHSTTTAQAATHLGGKNNKGGDILYRWGNPAAYRKGKVTDQKLYRQHDPYWIPKGFPNAGKIMVFNNGLGRPAGNYSSVEILTPPVNAFGVYSTKTMPFLPLTSGWIYTALTPMDFYSSFISGEQMLSNGNILVCNGNTGDFFELNTSKEKVWEYISPLNNIGPVKQGSPAGFSVFRCSFYPNTFAGFTGRDMTPGKQIELNPLTYDCKADTDFNHPQHVHTSGIFYDNATQNFSVINPVHDKITIRTNAIDEDVLISIYDITGRCAQAWGNRHVADGQYLDLDLNQSLKSGVYLLNITGANVHYTTRLVKE